ncbi:MAG TPA: hypothetical protein VF707_06965 [Ardenticatenaceae bacterium]
MLRPSPPHRATTSRRTTPIVPVETGSLPRWETKARRVRDLREE